MGLAPLHYLWRAERFPARRDRLVRYWNRVEKSVHHHLLHYVKVQAARAAAAATAAAAAASAAAASSTTTTVTTSGFPASCVAMAEEGGQNSWAGYFGFIYPPASYGFSGPSSWLAWSYSAQLGVAESLYARYGGSAWGPLTRQKCGI
jgi:hypothetical protein